MKFGIQFRNPIPVEERTVMFAIDLSDGHEYKIINNANEFPSGYIPVGTVEFVEKCFRAFTPEYYPEFLHEHLHRKIWKTDEWPQQKGLFVKPAHRYKAWDGKLTTGGYRGKKKGPYWVSEQVKFMSEFRYYVANGEVLFGEWYDGEIEKDAPSIDFVEFPSDYCGAVDFGELDNGKLALVEANHPYAVGWYGGCNNAVCRIYLDFLIKGYEYMLKLK